MEIGIFDSVISTFLIINGAPVPVSYTHLDVYKRQQSLTPEEFDDVVKAVNAILPHAYKGQ